jgi:hypothetical protein
MSDSRCVLPIFLRKGNSGRGSFDRSRSGAPFDFSVAISLHSIFRFVMKLLNASPSRVQLFTW